MATTSGARRRPQKYPDELREPAVRIVQEVRRETGEGHGVISRVAKELGVGVEPLRQRVNRAEIDSGRRPGTSIDRRAADHAARTREHRRCPEPTTS